MRIRFFLFVAILFFSCGNSEQKALQKVLQLERVLMLAEDVSSNEVLARKVLQEYTLFLELYPDADVAPELYFKSGEILKGLGQYLNAAKAFHQVHTKYKHTSIAPIALFQQADCFEAMDQRKTAKNTYEEFINRYPNHPYTDQAQDMIKLLHFSDQELIQKFNQ